MSRTRKPKKPSKASVKAAAARAEARSRGEEITEPKIPIDPPIERSGIEDEPSTIKIDVIGRPTAYDPSYDARAAELCLNGAKDEELAEEFDVSTRTINRWKVAHPTFRQAVKDAKDVADERVKRSLYHRALGIEYEETQAIKLKRTIYGDDGKKLRDEEYVELVPIKKFMPADTTAGIFWLKNRQAQHWRDVHKHEHGGPGSFDAMTEDEIDAYINAETAALMAPVKSGSRRFSTKH